MFKMIAIQRHGAKWLRSCSWIIIMAAMLLAISNTGCKSQPRNAARTPEVKSDEKYMVLECERVANEAVRLRNGAVSAYNSGRGDAALTLFEQSLNEWRQITNGALHCSPDVTTLASERFGQTLRERDEIDRRAR